MSDDLVEINVTRMARTFHVGTVRFGAYRTYTIGCDGEAVLRPGDQVMCRAPGGHWRPGLTRVRGDGHIDFSAFASVADGDVLYRVEPPP